MMNKAQAKIDMLSCLNKYQDPRSYKRQCVWNNKMAARLAKEPKSMTGFTFMPKGEVV